MLDWYRWLLKMKMQGMRIIVIDKPENYKSERLGRPIKVNLSNPDAAELIAFGAFLIYLGKILWLAGAEETRIILKDILCKETELCSKR